MIEIRIDPREIEAAARHMAETPALVQAALRSTVSKMTRWARTRSVRELSSKLAIQQKVLRPRVKARKLRRTASGSETGIWYGLNPVALIRLDARKSGRGVSARGGRRVEGAFIAQGKGGHRQVFKRAGRARLPIKTQTAEIEKVSTDFVQDDLAQSHAFRQRFLQVFEHELEWRTRRR